MKKENVVCVPLDSIKSSYDLERQYWPIDEKGIDSMPYNFLKRANAEHDYTHKQLIPYAIIHNSDGKILCYQRHGSEERLSGIFSLGIGGHVNDNDVGDCLSKILTNGLRREFAEEIGLNLPENRFELLGMINEDESEVGHCHIGVVYSVSIGDEPMTFDNEIFNPQWLNLEDIALSKFELWSSLALRLFGQIYGKQINEEQLHTKEYHKLPTP